MGLIARGRPSAGKPASDVGGLTQTDEVVPALLVRAATSVAAVGHEPVVVVKAADRLAELGVADVLLGDAQLVADLSERRTVNDLARRQPLKNVLSNFRPAPCHCCSPVVEVLRKTALLPPSATTRASLK